MEDDTEEKPSPPPLDWIGSQTRQNGASFCTPRNKKVPNLLSSILARERTGSKQWRHKFEEVLEYKTATASRLHFNYNLEEQTKSTFVVAFSPDRTKIATSHGNHSIKISDCFTFKILLTLKGHPRTPWCVTFHPAINSLLATGCLGGQVRLWDLNKVTNDDDNIVHQSQAVISSLTFHPTQDVLAISTHNKLIFYNWNKRTIIRAIQMKHRAQSIRLVRFLPNGSKLVTAVANTSLRYCKPERFNVSTRGDGSGNSVVETVTCMRLQRPLDEDGQSSRIDSSNVSDGTNSIAMDHSNNNNNSSSTESSTERGHQLVESSNQRENSDTYSHGHNDNIASSCSNKLKRKGEDIISPKSDDEGFMVNHSSNHSEKRRKKPSSALNSCQCPVNPGSTKSSQNTQRHSNDMEGDPAELQVAGCVKSNLTAVLSGDNSQSSNNEDSSSIQTTEEKVPVASLGNENTTGGPSTPILHTSSTEAEHTYTPDDTHMQGSCSCPRPPSNITNNQLVEEDTSSRSRPFYRRHRRMINLSDQDIQVSGQVSCERGPHDINQDRLHNNPPRLSSANRENHNLGRSDLWEFHFRGTPAPAPPSSSSSDSSLNNMNVSVDSTSSTVTGDEFLNFPFSNIHQSTHVTNFLGVQTAVATATARSSHHVHTAVVIASQEHENCEATLQTAVNRAIAGAFAGSGEGAVANNIIDTTHRLQMWDADAHVHTTDTDILDEKTNVIVPFCKIHNDSSLDISQDSSYVAVFVPNEFGFPMDAEVKVLSLRADSFLQCIYSRKFGPNAVSVSLSSLNNYVMIGLASRKLHWQLSTNQLIGQVLELPSASSEVNHGDTGKPVLSVYHKCAPNQRSNVSVNTLRFHPSPGMGIIYGTNRGHVQHCHIEPDLGLIEKRYVPKQTNTCEDQILREIFSRK